MPDDLITQLGIGGLFAVLVIKIVLDFLGNKKRNGTTGDKDPSFWQNEIRHGVSKELHEHVLPAIDRLERRIEKLIDGDRDDRKNERRNRR